MVCLVNTTGCIRVELHAKTDRRAPTGSQAFGRPEHADRCNAAFDDAILAHTGHGLWTRD